jgi:2-dehydropantoate 2-reductase
MRQVVPTSVTRNLADARWTKLLANLTNGLCAATGLSVAELGRNHLGRRLVVAVMREGHRVIRAARIKLDRHLLARLLLLALRTSVGRADFRGSTWQSLARGRPTEIDYLNGEIVRLGARVGVETPYNTRIVRAVHVAEQTNTRCTVRDLCPSAG